jgi:protoheme IX farnesyltransferase
MEVFNYSILYLMALFAFLLVDHYLDSGPTIANALYFEPVA